MKYKVGQTVTIKLSGGSIVEAEIKAIVQTKGGLRFKVAFGSQAGPVNIAVDVDGGCA